MAPIIRRLLSPTGFVLVGLLLFLPFLTLSCEGPTQVTDGTSFSLTYTGADLVVGGPADVDVAKRTADGNVADGSATGTTDDEEFGLGELTLPAQPFAVVAAVLLVVGVASAVLPWARWRVRVAAAAAFLAGIALVAAVLSTENRVVDVLRPSLEDKGEELIGEQVKAQQLFDAFEYRFGFWIEVVALAVLGFANVWAAVPGRRVVAEEPVAAQEQPA